MTRLDPHHSFDRRPSRRSPATQFVGSVLAIGTMIAAMAGAYAVGTALASVPWFALVAALVTGISILVAIPVGIELLSRRLGGRFAARRATDDESARSDPTPMTVRAPARGRKGS